MAAWAPGQGGPPPGWQVPDTDMDDNPNAQPPPPGQPNMAQFPQIQGYGNMGGFGQFSPLPPPPPPPMPPPPPAHTQFAACAQLTEEECREALLQFVSEHCCYGSKPAKNLAMTNFLASTALRYKLETFCEGRQTGYRQEPFRGQPIDGPQNGPAPPPWQIPVMPDGEFRDHKKDVEVPHTATVQDPLGGNGRRSCSTCGGDGRITCHTCQGYRQLKCYICLTVTFVNHVEDFIIEATDMPDELIRDVAGNTVLEQTQLYCFPIVGYPVPDIASNSARLVDKHNKLFTGERRLNQRQTLIAIPVTEVHYDYDENKSRFWVYGLDRKVYFPDYPATCCWGCSVL